MTESITLPKNILAMLVTALVTIGGAAGASYSVSPHRDCVSPTDLRLAIKEHETSPDPHPATKSLISNLADAAEDKATQRASEYLGRQLDTQAQTLARIETKLDDLDSRLRAVEQRAPTTTTNRSTR